VITRATRLAVVLGALCARPAAADPAAPADWQNPEQTAEPAVPGDVRSPEQANRRKSAYTAPRGMLIFELGVFGVGGNEAFARLGATYGLGAGVEIEANLAHAGVGLLNVSAAWHFLDTRHFDLGVGAGFWYGHGEWFWIASGATESVVSKVDALSLPVGLTASALVARWVQLDLGVHYTYGNAFGETDGEDSLFEDAEIGIRQLFVQPGVRFFVSDSTAFELFAKLPTFTDVPRSRGDETLPFADTWSLDAGLRSRLAAGLFGNLRLHYGNVADVVYGAPLYPSFAVEYRL